MSYANSTVLIVEAGSRADAEQLGVMLGHSGAEYSVALSPDGGAPATHYGLHSWTSDAFLAILTGPVPPGMDSALFESVRQALTVSTRVDALGHFDDVLGQVGLVRVAG